MHGSFRISTAKDEEEEEKLLIVLRLEGPKNVLSRRTGVETFALMGL
jgi:hypothetical protein